MENEIKIERISCSFCGQGIECPENMLNVKKHSCFECFRKLQEEWSNEESDGIHVDFPRDKLNEYLPAAVIRSMVEDVFPKIWHERKEMLKEMSKKELAQEMFGAGVHLAVGSLFDMKKKYEMGEKPEMRKGE
ncbi:hypothetical protein HYU13_03895 [Candidatus Woesearchaeota archaeon]|nr:hypothetical protein [Candidatus Woesearchaeota archaeon]